jgi:putative flavoprotein involved in K+ transport
VKLHGRVVDTAGSTVRFADGSDLLVDAVVWATGFRPDHSWVEVPVFDDVGKLVHERGVTAAPGLYFLGLSWQHTRGSALLGFVKDDAEHIADQIAAFTGSSRTEPDRRAA